MSGFQLPIDRDVKWPGERRTCWAFVLERLLFCWTSRLQSLAAPGWESSSA
jgi:hypothetical protein